MRSTLILSALVATLALLLPALAQDVGAPNTKGPHTAPSSSAEPASSSSELPASSSEEPAPEAPVPPVAPEGPQSLSQQLLKAEDMLLTNPDLKDYPVHYPTTLGTGLNGVWFSSRYIQHGSKDLDAQIATACANNGYTMDAHDPFEWRLVYRPGSNFEYTTTFTAQGGLSYVMSVDPAEYAKIFSKKDTDPDQIELTLNTTPFQNGVVSILRPTPDTLAVLLPGYDPVFYGRCPDANAVVTPPAPAAPATPVAPATDLGAEMLRTAAIFHGNPESVDFNYLYPEGIAKGLSGTWISLAVLYAPATGGDTIAAACKAENAIHIDASDPLKLQITGLVSNDKAAVVSFVSRGGIAYAETTDVAAAKQSVKFQSDATTSWEDLIQRIRQSSGAAIILRPSENTLAIDRNDTYLQLFAKCPQ